MASNREVGCAMPSRPRQRLSNLSRKELEHLAAYDQVGEVRPGLKDVAAVLGSTPSNVSRVLDDIEDYLRVKLTTKDHGLRQLCPEYAAIPGEAQALLTAIDNFDKKLRIPPIGTLAVACFPVHIQRVLGEVARDLAQQPQPLALRFYETPADPPSLAAKELFGRLTTGEVDFAMGASDEHPGCTSEIVYQACLVAILPPDKHASWQRWRSERRVTLPELAANELLVMRRGYFYRPRFERELAKAGLLASVKIIMETSDALLLVHLAGLGSGIGVVTDDLVYLLAKASRTEKQLVQVFTSRNAKDPITIDVRIYWRANKVLSAAEDQFLTCLRDHIRKST